MIKQSTIMAHMCAKGPQRVKKEVCILSIRYVIEGPSLNMNLAAIKDCNCYIPMSQSLFTTEYYVNFLNMTV